MTGGVRWEHGRTVVVRWLASTLVVGGAAAWLRWGWADRIASPVLAVAAILLFVDGLLTFALIIATRRRLRPLADQGAVAAPPGEWRAGATHETARWVAPALLRLVRWELSSTWTGTPPAQAAWRAPEPPDPSWREQVAFGGRGLWDRQHHLQRRLRICGILGPWSADLVVDEVRETSWILPAEIQPPDFTLARDLVAGEEDAADGKPEGDRIDFRRYAEGDSARHIAWKLTARKGDDGPIMVRIPDRVGSPRVGALFSAGPGDEPAAELFLHLLENERLGPNWAAAVVCPGIEPDACVGRHQLPELGRRLCHSAGAAAASDLTGSIHLLRQAGCGLIVVMGAMPTELPAGVVALRAQRRPAPGGERPGADGEAIWVERRTA